MKSGNENSGEICFFREKLSIDWIGQKEKKSAQSNRSAFLLVSSGLPWASKIAPLVGGFCIGQFQISKFWFFIHFFKVIFLLRYPTPLFATSEAQNLQIEAFWTTCCCRSSECLYRSVQYQPGFACRKAPVQQCIRFNEQTSR